jgi:hypothetical protein
MHKKQRRHYRILEDCGVDYRTDQDEHANDTRNKPRTLGFSLPQEKKRHGQPHCANDDHNWYEHYVPPFILKSMAMNTSISNCQPQLLRH